MSSRWSLILLLLLLANCATTGTELADTGPVQEPEQSAVVLPRGSGESIDTHLFVPEQPAATLLDDVQTEPQLHVHPHIWERLVHNFALPECSSHKISRNWAQWYADQTDYMARVFKRAQPWIYFIAQELERRGLPGELALLRIVVSALDPFDYSRGRAM